MVSGWSLFQSMGYRSAAEASETNRRKGSAILIRSRIAEVRARAASRREIQSEYANDCGFGAAGGRWVGPGGGGEASGGRERRDATLVSRSHGDAGKARSAYAALSTMDTGRTWAHRTYNRSGGNQDRRQPPAGGVETRFGEYVCVSHYGPGGCFHARRRVRPDFASRGGRILLRRLGDQRTGGNELEPTGSVSAGRPGAAIPGDVEGATLLALWHGAADRARIRRRDPVSTRSPDDAGGF